MRAYGIRRVYAATPGEGGSAALQLHDHMVVLGPKERAAYEKLVELHPTPATDAEIAAALGMDAAKLARFAARLAESGLLYRRADVPRAVSGEAFYHEHFAPVLDAWLGEAFSHPFWERMSSGRGSARLYTGWTLELYHYTRNANRHMPLSAAHARDKAVKLLRARHYTEEWNHYHYFAKALRHLGLDAEAIEASVPLAMTLALSNFMRQAAREDVLAYSVCSAVLEGTTASRRAYDPYHEQVVALYGVPREAVKPIYDHLDLDVQYQHGNLFLEILRAVPEITAARGARILEYGHQLVEHVWMWTESIERYYEDERNPVPRRAFDPFLD